jgi:hypothetical protein
MPLSGFETLVTVVGAQPRLSIARQASDRSRIAPAPGAHCCASPLRVAGCGVQALDAAELTAGMDNPNLKWSFFVPTDEVRCISFTADSPAATPGGQQWGRSCAPQDSLLSTQSLHGAGHTLSAM